MHKHKEQHCSFWKQCQPSVLQYFLFPKIARFIFFICLHLLPNCLQKTELSPHILFVGTSCLNYNIGTVEPILASSKKRLYIVSSFHGTVVRRNKFNLFFVKRFSYSFSSERNQIILSARKIFSIAISFLIISRTSSNSGKLGFTIKPIELSIPSGMLNPASVIPKAIQMTCSC